MKKIALAMSMISSLLCADNQTEYVSVILPGRELPYSVEVTKAEYELPVGLHSGAIALYDGKWVIIGGRLNGLHGFDPGDDNFPPDQQNTSIFVVDYKNKKTYSRPLDVDEALIDTLSVTSSQYYQKGDTLYITGGYGVITATGEFSTKDTLTAVDLPGIIKWVMFESTHTASHYLRQTQNSALQVTGGDMFQIGDEPTLLIFGQNFAGFYHDESNGDYTCQVRPFKIHDDGKTLSVSIKDPIPENPEPAFRRRDLNVVPIIEGNEKAALMAYSGVFTLTSGIWTVPVHISAKGEPTMENPNSFTSLKQGMNNYVSSTLGLYSKKCREMYTLIFGGLSYGYFADGSFQTDSEVPFINQITTIKRDSRGVQTQYLMDATFPEIISTQSNPGNPLLFGTGAMYFPKTDIPHYENNVLKLDELPKGRTHVGYIVGGIQSTLPNTNSNSDSAASPYIFKVYLNI